jgi:hypothetical protein
LFFRQTGATSGFDASFLGLSVIASRIQSSSITSAFELEVRI